MPFNERLIKSDGVKLTLSSPASAATLGGDDSEFLR